MSKDTAIKNLSRLIDDNPNLPVVAMVDGEICLDGDMFWLGSITKCSVEEYLLDPYDYPEYSVKFKGDDDDAIIEHIAESKYGDCTVDENWKKAEADLAGLWKKAIVVWVGMPDKEAEDG